MARSWTRLHEFLGSPPGPVTYDMVAEAVQRKLAESDDLDWKQALPLSSKVKGQWNEFAKDVAAMANTRGGLLIYGVSDTIDMIGLDLSTVDDKQLSQWLRVHLQPTVRGVSYLKLEATDGSGKGVLVVDVPASETAPHFLYGWEDKDKGKTTFNAPFRHRDDTAYMAEHQVASAYRERFRRQDAAEVALERHVLHATDLVLNESADRPTAWLIVAARLSRPIPRMVPQPTRTTAQWVVDQGTRHARTMLDRAVRMPRLLGPQLFPDLLSNDPRKGLRRWVDTNLFVPAWSDNRRGVLLEMHHDGTVVTAVDLSRNALPTGSPQVELPVISWVLISAVFETVALAHEHRQALHSEAPMDLQAVVQTRATDTRFTPVVLDFGRPEVSERARQPSALQPVFGELPPFADDQALVSTGRELAEGLLHQFGLDMPD